MVRTFVIPQCTPSTTIIKNRKEKDKYCLKTSTNIKSNCNTGWLILPDRKMCYKGTMIKIMGDPPVNENESVQSYVSIEYSIKL
jgi:hypothetical protein